MLFFVIAVVVVVFYVVAGDGVGDSGAAATFAPITRNKVVCRYSNNFLISLTIKLCDFLDHEGKNGQW